MQTDFFNISNYSNYIDLKEIGLIGIIFFLNNISNGNFPFFISLNLLLFLFIIFVIGIYQFPKRNFNTALIGFLTCVQELGDHVTKHDPTLQLPYTINVNDGKIISLENT